MAEGYGHGKPPFPMSDDELADFRHRLAEAMKRPAEMLPPVDPDAEAERLAEARQPGEFTVTPEIHAALIAAGWTPPPSLAERVRKIATRDRTRG